MVADSLTARFAFSGGNNVTLRGSEDPEWGWVDGHGQAVCALLIHQASLTLTEGRTVVGCSTANQSPAWVGLQQDHERRHSRYETLEGKADVRMQLQISCADLNTLFQACCVELRHKQLEEYSCFQQQDCGGLKHWSASSLARCSLGRAAC